MSQMKKAFGMVLVVGLLAASGIASSQSATHAEEIKARIAPVGTVCMSGDECAAAPAAPASAEPRSGKEVYDATCGTCHAIGVSGAPKFGNAGDWAPRVAQGIDVLYTHALEGLNAMPARGLCMNCSDDELKAAVDYMVNAAK